MNAKQHMLVLCGLPGTGKSTLTQRLSQSSVLEYTVIDQNAIRRELGWKRYPKDQSRALRLMDERIQEYLATGKNVIIDSVNRLTSRRNQYYGIASGAGVSQVLLIQTVCSEKVSKERMMMRPKSDGLISDPRDTSVYDKMQSTWESAEEDFKHSAVNSHVSWVLYDSESNLFIPQRTCAGSKSLIRALQKIVKGSK